MSLTIYHPPSVILSMMKSVTVEISEDHPCGHTSCLFMSLLQQRRPPSFGFGRNSKTDRGGMFYSERNVLICLDWKLLTWGRWRQLTRSTLSHMLNLKSVFYFLAGLSWKPRQKLGKLAGIDQVLTVLGQLLQRLRMRVLLS